MLYSIIEATGTGTSQVLSVPPYLSQDHISVLVNGIPFTNFTWLTAGTISLTAAVGATIQITRQTSPGARLVNYPDGRAVPAADLNTDSLQAFYMAQEAADSALMADTDPGSALALALGSNTGAGLVGTSRGSVGGELDRQFNMHLRDVRTFPGIVADNVTDDFVALQAAFVTARDTGCGIWWPKGVKTFVQFSSTHPYMFIDGKVGLASADRFTSGISFHCNYDMGSVHAPLFCWGIPSKGATVNKVTGFVRDMGWFMKAGTQKFERLCHIYGAKDFTVENNYADLTTVTFPAADGGHPSGYQAGGWWASNSQPSFAVGQTRDQNIKFLNNVGFASAEYQNAESIGITNCYGLQYIGNYLVGFADDLAAHICTFVRYEGNHYEAVSGRFYVENSHHVTIVGNEILPLVRPLAGGYVGPQRSFIMVNMSTQYASILNDVPNYDINILDNSIYLPSGCFCQAAVKTYGVQDGVTIRGNRIYNDGASSGGGNATQAVVVSTLFRDNGGGAVWTGPAGNPDFTAGGAIRMRSVDISGNRLLGGGWAANEGLCMIQVYAGGSASDILGPVNIDNNLMGAYNVAYEPVRFGEGNRALAASTDPYKAVSPLALYRNSRFAIPLVAAQNLNFTSHPVGSALLVQDAYGLNFVAQADGSLRGVILTLTAAMVSGNSCTASIVKNGVALGVDTQTSSLVSGTNSYRYLVSFNNATMTFAKGDNIGLKLAFSAGQTTSIVGKAELLYLYN